MSAKTYLEAAERLKAALDVLGTKVGPCGFCGHPDQRHRVAEAIAERIVAGEDGSVVARDYLPFDGDAGFDFEPEVLQLAVFTLATDHRLHSITRSAAAGIDRQVWAS